MDYEKLKQVMLTQSMSPTLKSAIESIIIAHEKLGKSVSECLDCLAKVKHKQEDK